MNDQTQLWLLRRLPKRAISRLAGRFARSSASRRLIRPFARKYEIDVTEADRPLHDYRSLCDFFSRGLRPGTRPIDEGPSVIVSPVDGVISEQGTIQQDTLVQAKGVTYSVAQLLASNQWSDVFDGGWYITIYLSPSNYHRIHMPLSAAIHESVYVPGTLYPVNPVGVGGVPGLFARNERLISFARAEEGLFAVVKVGATIVGSVKVVYDPEARTNLRRPKLTRKPVRGIFLAKGEEIGRFEFGSTVILLFQKGMIASDSAVASGTTIRMGERLASLQSQGWL